MVDLKMRLLIKIIKKLIMLVRIIQDLDERLDEIKFNQGLIINKLNKNNDSKSIRDYEFKVFSQWGEDGIIQHLTNVIEIKNKTFIEFGVEDFFESNCRFLLMKDNWKGFIIDGSIDNICKLKKSYLYWKYHLNAIASFITKDNINFLLEKSGFDEDVGILSIDLDGNDYYILDSISKFKPRILICEFNPLFDPHRKISIPYQENFYRTKAHYSNLYWGASLGAFCFFAKRKGYSLVGTNSAGCNAFFVRNDLINEKVQVLSIEQAFTQANYRESKDEHGVHSYLTGDERIKIIKGMSVLDVEKNTMEIL